MFNYLLLLSRPYNNNKPEPLVLLQDKPKDMERRPSFSDLSTAKSLALDHFLEYQKKDLVEVFPLIPHDLVWVQCHKHLLSREENVKTAHNFTAKTRNQSSALLWPSHHRPQAIGFKKNAYSSSKSDLLTLGQGFHLTQAK